jgi:hypothetical protein
MSWLCARSFCMFLINESFQTHMSAVYRSSVGTFFFWIPHKRLENACTLNGGSESSTSENCRTTASPQPQSTAELLPVPNRVLKNCCAGIFDIKNYAQEEFRNSLNE